MIGYELITPKHGGIYRGTECIRICGKHITNADGMRRDVERKAFNAIYDDDELYARHIRANENLRRPNTFEIFDELPEGWTTHLSEHGERGLRGRYDTTSKYVWCENMPMYIRVGSIYRVNPEYRQSLVRR